MGYLPTTGPPVPFNVASEGRFRISEAVAGGNRDMLAVAFERGGADNRFYPLHRHYPAGRVPHGDPRKISQPLAGYIGS